VLDLADGKGEMCGRLLADLGADVILVEPRAGAGSRRQQPLLGDTSLYFATHNANKRSVALDLDQDADKESFLQLVEGADILIETSRPGTLERLGLGADALLARNPQLVALSITDFGQTGPYRDFVATDSVHMALGGVLCRTGLPEPGQPPLLPPGSLAWENAAVQAAWCALIGYWQRLHTGVGDHLDFSIHDATVQVIDPGLGVTGSASAGRSAMEQTPRGRPRLNPLYPIFPCADGYVRICVLNPRQWQGMSDWLGDSHPFRDPVYGNIAKRAAEIGPINALIAELFHDKRKAELVQEGQRRGVPIAAVATPQDVLKDEHFAARGALARIDVAPGASGKIPTGYLEVDGSRAGIRSRAPALGEHNDAVLGQPVVRRAAAASGKPGRRPFEGVRVLDLGVIVAGAELGRVFADMGAEVIKVENRAFPDGGRQSSRGEAVTTSFTQGHRGKESLGLNLRSPGGVELFKQLVAKSDLVFSNFKPGTMESLGLGYDVLKEINPGIIMADSSALGRTGPMSRSMGYGPLVRASSALTGLWRYPQIDNSYSDGVTIVPDHFAARVAAAGVAAALIRRQRTGIGGTVSVSQAETILTAMSALFLRESLEPGSFVPRGNAGEYDAPDGVFPCAGDDEWCVVSVRDDGDWQNLCRAIGRADLLDDQRLAGSEGRLAHREEVEGYLSAWTGSNAPEAVMQTLQAAGVPAGMMLRLTDYETNPHLLARNFFRVLEQPGLPGPLLTENAPVRSRTMPDPEIRPAPLQGEHTREVMARVLGLSAGEIEALIASGDLEVAEAGAA
jgi:crotonobetainyl-CoA:carnitine CoA-transferase CaiB-like acyl-CoA transferase